MRKSVANKSFASKRYAPYDLIISYLCDIFGMHKKDDGYVCFRSGVGGHAAQSWLCVDKLSENLKIELSRHDYCDAYFSFATFQKAKTPHHSDESVQNIFAWSIDVDYKNSAANPLDVYEYIMSNVSIPTPNYIEYGHRLRMIYIFAEPLRLYSKQKDTLLKGFNFLQKAFCQIINEELGFMGESFGAESNHVGTFFRIPGSINTKDGSTIRIKYITDEKWTLQELFEEWIPQRIIAPSSNRDLWYQKWKDNSELGMQNSELGVRIKNPSRRFNARMLWERRMNILEKLRTYPNPHRKKLCFYYAAGITQTLGTISADAFMDKLIVFNDGFANPLPEHILKRTFKWQAAKQPLYRFTDISIADDLEVDRQCFSICTRKEKDAIRYQHKRKEQIANADTKKQKMEKRMETVSKLLSAGMSCRMIAEKLSVSLSTVKRDSRRAIRNSECGMRNDSKTTHYASRTTNCPSALCSMHSELNKAHYELNIPHSALSLLVRKVRNILKHSTDRKTVVTESLKRYYVNMYAYRMCYYFPHIRGVTLGRT